MNPSAWDYIRKAFNARPIGMFVPPNWIGLGAFALLGVLNPGFWVIGLGVELGLPVDPGQQQALPEICGRLAAAGDKAAVADKSRCADPAAERRGSAAIPGFGSALPDAAGTATADSGSVAGACRPREKDWAGCCGCICGFSRRVRRSTGSFAGQAGAPNESAGLEERIANLQSRLQESLTEDLRKSITGQIEILQQRLERRSEAKDKLAFLDAELTRIQEQVELVREQAVLSADPETLSKRIDEVTATLGGTTQWISDQQKIYGAVEDLMSEPPQIQLTIDE